MAQQKQFLDVISPDLAKSRFEAAISLIPAEEVIPLNQALGRTLSRDVSAKVNVPSFDRSNLDGFAVKASDTIGAEEYSPISIQLLKQPIAAGATPKHEVVAGVAVLIATGGMLPRGADAIVMVENADVREDKLVISKPVSPGSGIAFAGTDVASGQIVLYQGDLLTSRETGILAAIGETEIHVWKRPKVAVISTGNEIIAPGQPMSPGLVYDSNARIIADAVRELGGEPLELGIAIDNPKQLREKIQQAFQQADMILLSGGTSKGEGDLSYQVVYELEDPGVIVHGVALKPGKPICLAASQGKPVVVLPGFPTSAIFTFHEFVAPVIRQLAGLSAASQSVVPAELAVRVNSEIGRAEFLLVRLLDNSQLQLSEQQNQENPQKPKLAAYPIGKGSGSVTTFSNADGFVRIDQHVELLEAGSPVKVQLISRDTKPADLVIIGSHCLGLDLIMSLLKRKGIQVRFMSVGSSAGLIAVKRGQCDIAGIHLFDPASASYNQHCVTEGLSLIQGYRRQQGLIFRADDPRFQGDNAKAVVAQVKNDPDCLMINRNLGSGTRVLIEQLLEGSKPNGYLVQTSNHRAVFAAIQQKRADWGVAIQSLTEANTGFLEIQDECYDFMVANAKLQKKAVQVFMELLQDKEVQAALAKIGINADKDSGTLYQ
ncbi:MAG: molybdopterin molybdotransferase /putative molybdopterin biosynthesis protein [Methyloprofundus sp.]|nr:MAG: molybdopterin molybdotransferase /putative molybdopterin biosynthesis protein [Methyloprofundus sp.]